MSITVLVAIEIPLLSDETKKTFGLVRRGGGELKARGMEGGGGGFSLERETVHKFAVVRFEL